jgi:DNA recombination protein Rad52
VSTFSQAQHDLLLEPIKGYRVKKDQNGMSYLEGYEVIAHLNRVFDFDGWEQEVIDLVEVYDSKIHDDRRNRDGYFVCYRATVQLTVRGVTREDVGTGVAENQPSRAAAHDLAVKSAVTDGLKRAARTLGDQFGLSLYADGSLDALVKKTLPREPEKALQ